ncbi:hypothetical protein [Pedobacter cryoconitis]|uniref:Uncharacterized protein n=1 Tax=Pedobacter cryoconitis TaxID=188932 RepID=A0A327SBF8_9SPHI|nr:hypothetical protein [Pedobacter cryoconitis]RAJ24983.1 hypothetical protein LY11_04170 [Pedobacter cryoconitis]
MKKAIFNVFLIVCLLISTYLLFNSERSNSRLIRQIELKDSLSKNITKNDSVFAEKTKEYAKVITKYVSNCNFKIGKKSISTPELLKITNKAIIDAEVYKDSLRIMKFYSEQYKKNSTNLQVKAISNSDSTFIYKGLLGIVLENYKIKPDYSRDGDRFHFFIKGISTVDSALVLFPYYKHNLRRDTLTNVWTTVMDTERNIKRQTKKNKKD